MSNTIESAAHSEIGASSYSRWSTIHGGCPGSVQMCRGLPNTESEYAKEGTHAHTVASQLLDKHFFKKDPPEGYLAPTGDEMLEAVMVYVEWVKKLGRRVGQTVLIEHRFDLKDVHPGLFGTADAIVYTPQDLKLTVADYKHGAGIAVEVEDNIQLQYYALGALLSTGFPCDKVEIAIIQPRCEHHEGKVRTWEFSSVELLDFAADLAYDAAEVFKPNAPLNPGKHCRFCPAAATKCTAIKQKAQELAKIEFGAGLSYDPDQLAKALQFIPALEAWIKKVHEFAYGEAMHGRLPPGWKLVAKRATRKWNAPEDDIVKYMVDATKKDPKDFYDQPSLKSPAQMEKLCSKQIGEGLRQLMVSISSGYNLAPESDDRPPAKLDAKAEFTKIEGD